MAGIAHDVALSHVALLALISQAISESRSEPMSRATVTVPRRTLERLLEYAQQERDVDHYSSYSHATKRVEPSTVRRRLERFDKIAAEIRAILRGKP